MYSVATVFNVDSVCWNNKKNHNYIVQNFVDVLRVEKSGKNAKKKLCRKCFQEFYIGKWIKESAFKYF